MYRNEAWRYQGAPVGRDDHVELIQRKVMFIPGIFGGGSDSSGRTNCRDSSIGRSTSKSPSESATSRVVPIAPQARETRRPQSLHPVAGDFAGRLAARPASSLTSRAKKPS